MVVYFVFLRIANERIVSCGPSCLKFQPQVDSRGVQGAIALPGAPMFAAKVPSWVSFQRRKCEQSALYVTM